MRKTGETTTVGGFEVPEWATVYTDLPTYLHTDPRGSSSRGTTVGRAESEQAARVQSFPFDTVLEDADMVVITAGANVDQVFRVADATTSDQQSALRVNVNATQRPSEWA
jgi:hypothetical protein